MSHLLASLHLLRWCLALHGDFMSPLVDDLVWMGLVSKAFLLKLIPMPILLPA